MHFDYGAITRCDVGFQQLHLYTHFVTSLVKRCYCLTTPTLHGDAQYKYWASPCKAGLGSSRFARRYLGNIVTTSHCFLFLLVLRCFTSQGALLVLLRYRVIEVYSIGFPHSDISGSKVIRHLPEAYRRLSRLSSPCRT